MDVFSVNFLIVLPELWQLIIVNVLLIFALCFSGVQKPSSNSTEQLATEKVTSAEKMTHMVDYGTKAEGIIGQKPKQKLTTKAKGFKSFSEALAEPNQAITACAIGPVLQVQPVCVLMVLGLLCSAHMYMNTALNYAIVFHTLVWDHLAQLMSVLLCLSAAAALILGGRSLYRFSRYEFILIIWLSILGMLCLIKSYNFLAFYLSVELQSLSFYMLASMRSRTEASAEAGLKYFILSAFSSAILLLGMCLIYGAVGSQNWSDIGLTMAHFDAIQSYQTVNKGLYVGFGCICVSLLFKLAAAPFHAWIADVYEGSQTAITAFFAITSKIAVATALIRVLSNATTLMPLLTGVAATSLLIGSLSAMRQVKLKRLLAFSGVANVGWFLLALVAGQWQLLVIHLIVYILLNITLFSSFLTPLFRTHPDLAYRQRVNKGQVSDHGADSVTIKYISDLHQVYKVNPSLAFAITIAMFSLAGMPPLAGFYSKYLIINAITQTQYYGVLALSLAAAVISAFYYIRVIKTIYFSTEAAQINRVNHCWFTVDPAPANAMVIACSTALTFAFFIKPDYFCIWLAM